MDKTTIWHQALSTEGAIRLDSRFAEGVIYRGYKVLNNKGEVKILSTRDNYKEVRDYRVFFDHGFKRGTELLSGQHYATLINGVNASIKAEVNKKTNNKKYTMLKHLRKAYMARYVKLNLKPIQNVDC